MGGVNHLCNDGNNFIEHTPDWVWHIIIRLWDNDYLIEHNQTPTTREYFEGLCEGILMFVDTNTPDSISPFWTTDAKKSPVV